MARIFLIILTFFMFCTAYAAGVYIRNNGHFSELVIAGMAEKVVSVTEGESKMVIELLNPLSADAGGSFNDPFIKSLSVDGKMVTLSFFPETDYTMFRKDGNILITAARKKKNDGIEIGYGIEQPLINSDDKILDDKNAEEVLGMIDSAVAEDDLPYALAITENYLNSGIDGYYKQEGLFRLGMIYFKMGDQSEDNYVFASKIFDDFIKEYPESFRKKDVLIKTAEAKELAMQYNEAVFAYNNVIKSLRDREIRKMAFERIADIYAKAGQYKKAIEAHEDVIRHFKETFTPQKAKIGMLQAKQKDYDLAYRTFLTVLENKNDLGLLGPEELYTMADVFSKRSQYSDAREAYEKVYSLYPSNDLADMSMYQSAEMLNKEGKRSAADARLDICRQVYKEKKGGLLCSVMFAREHMKEKVPQEWEKALDNALNAKDLDIRSEAELVLIRAFFAENEYEEAEKRVDSFIKKNFTSEHLPEVYDIRQRISITMAKDAFEKSDYPKAQGIIQDMLADFPDTVYRKEATEILQDIHFGDIKDKYYAGMYKETIAELTQYLTDNQDLINPEKWFFMLQEAKYSYAKQLYDQNNMQDTVVASAEYRTSFPNGIHKDEVNLIMKDAISREMDKFYDNKEFIKIISLNDQNSDFVEKEGDELFRDKVRSYTAFALYKMGIKDKSLDLLNMVEDKKNPYYLMTALMLGLVKDVDPNVFTEGMMSYLVQEFETEKPKQIVDMLKRYTKDKKFASKQIYSISKGVFNDLEREAILFDLYSRLDSDENARFDGFDEVYLDAGIAYYKRNNFESAATALEKFKLNHMPRDEQRAEGLYYLGKSYMKMKNKQEQTVNALMELLESVPNSVYASAARSELEEIEWRKKLTK